VNLEALPPIHGISWRMFRDGDYAALARLENIDLEEGGHGLYQPPEDVQRSYESTEGLDAGKDILIAESADHFF